jgi:hypothetical protein
LTTGAPVALRGMRPEPQRLSKRSSRRPSLRLTLFGVVAVALIGVVGFALSREAATTSRTGGPQPVLPAPRPALSPEEQTYIEALWPIHTQVERNVVRVGLGTAFFKVKDLDRAQLKTRLDEALATYRQAEERLRALQPPPSLRVTHEGYLAAVQLFQRSTVEMLRMYEDGKDEHLVTAFPLSLEGSNKIREIGDRFWPGEYPPN